MPLPPLLIHSVENPAGLENSGVYRVCCGHARGLQFSRSRRESCHKSNIRDITVLMSESGTSEVTGAASRPPGRWILGLTADMPLLDALERIFRQRLHGVMYYLPLAAE